MGRLRAITLGLLGVLSVGGLLGGLAFLIDPTGAKLRMSVENLPAWPLLDDYTVPGVALIVLFGLFPLVAAAQLARRRPSGWPLTTAVGLLLVLWNVGQVAAIGFAFPPLQAGFLIVGILLTGLGIDGNTSVGTSDESRPLVRS